MNELHPHPRAIGQTKLHFLHTVVTSTSSTVAVGEIKLHVLHITLSSNLAASPFAVQLDRQLKTQYPKIEQQLSALAVQFAFRSSTNSIPILYGYLSGKRLPVKLDIRPEIT